jgi:hypothetical protein
MSGPVSAQPTLPSPHLAGLGAEARDVIITPVSSFEGSVTLAISATDSFGGVTSTSSGTVTFDFEVPAPIWQDFTAGL